jgi:hypothetical protein
MPRFRVYGLRLLIFKWERFKRICMLRFRVGVFLFLSVKDLEGYVP